MSKTAILNDTLNISTAEWEVMRVLWAESPLTSRDIINRLMGILDWKEGTIKSLINRLSQKNGIEKIPNTSPFQFQPTMSEKEANYIKAEEMMEPVCTRDRAMVIQHLIHKNDLSQSDIHNLIQVLEAKLETAPVEVKCQCPIGQCHCRIH